MAKCCNYTDNASPTLAQCQAIETNWNTFINNFFTEMDDKYPSTDLTIIDLNQGTTLLKNEVTGIVKRHETTDRPMYRVMTTDLRAMEIADEELSALRLKGHLAEIDDDIIQHNMQIHLNSQRMIVGVMTALITFADRKDDEGDPLADPPVAADPDKVTTLGLTNGLAAGEITLRTHEGHMQYGGYAREELVYGNLIP